MSFDNTTGTIQHDPQLNRGDTANRSPAMQLKFDWLILLETLRLKERLMANPNDREALKFFAVSKESKDARKKA